MQTTILAAHGPRSCLSVRTQPLTATGAPSQTSTIPTIPVITCALYGDATLGQGTSTTWYILPSISMVIQLRAYAMPSVPVHPVTLLTDMVSRCRLLAANGVRSCLSARTQPPTATGAPSQTSTIPYHTRCPRAGRATGANNRSARL